MKKHITRVIATVLLMTVFILGACSAIADETPSAIAYRIHSNFVIDGAIDDWNLESPIILDSESQVIRDLVFWNGSSDLSAKLYVAWDEANLYIAADITEDSPFGAIEMLPLDGEDNFELYISTNPNDDSQRTEYSVTDFRVFLIMDGEYWDTAIDRSMVTDRQRFVSKGMDGGENVLEGYQCAAKPTTTGFIFEAVIPWANFSNSKIPVYTPKTGDTIKFDFCVTDISYPCPGTEYIPQMAWTGDLGINTNPSLWGNLVFSD